MAEVELKDVAVKDPSPAISPLTPKVEEKKSENNPSTLASSSAAAAGEPSPVVASPNPVKMPQVSAMKRPDPQQNGGEAFVNCDGTVAEAPRMKKVTRTDGRRSVKSVTELVLCRVSLCGDYSGLANLHEDRNSCKFTVTYHPTTRRDNGRVYRVYYMEYTRCYSCASVCLIK